MLLLSSREPIGRCVLHRVAVVIMPCSSEPREACVTKSRMTETARRVLRFLMTKHTITYRSAISRVMLRKTDPQSVYYILCILEGIGLLRKDKKQYKLTTQRYQELKCRKDSLKRNVGIMYHNVRTSTGLLYVQDFVIRFHITLRRLYDIFSVLVAIGAVTKVNNRCYRTSTSLQSHMDLYWKQALDKIWGPSHEVKVVQSESPEVIWIDINEPSSDSHIILSETHDVHLGCIPTANLIFKSESHPGEGQCMDTEGLSVRNFEFDHIAMELFGNTVDHTNTESLLQSLLWLDWELYSPS